MLVSVQIVNATRGTTIAMWKVWVSLALMNTITTQQPNATFRITFKLVHKQRSLWHYYRTSCWTWKCRALASFESQAIVYNEQFGQQSSENLKVFTNLLKICDRAAEDFGNSRVEEAWFLWKCVSIFDKCTHHIDSSLLYLQTSPFGYWIIL